VDRNSVNDAESRSIMPSKPDLDDRTDGDALLWNEMVKRDTKEGYEFYVSEFPSGRNLVAAKKRLEEFALNEEELLWESSKETGTTESLGRYLSAFPNGKYSKDAERLLEAQSKRDDLEAWRVAEGKKTAEAYREYLGKFPKGEYISLARLRLKDMGASLIPDGSVGTFIMNSIGMQLAWIPSGSFMMGSPASEANRSNDEGPQRLVTIGQGFWMGRYEVTQGQYEAVMGTNPSAFKTCGRDCPVEQVSWNDAKEFISRLNARNDGFVYSLPSEAEWEYAARAGTTTAFAFGNSLSSTQANFDGNYPYGNAPKGPYLERTTKVGSYRPNAWGLYDMHGNVWEWAEDIYQDSYTGLPTDGSANTTRGDSSFRLLRGGSWGSLGGSSRSAYRGSNNLTYRNLSLGFRVVARAR
jgi:formylglycine-generating enzyme required for sulfatase activity